MLRNLELGSDSPTFTNSAVLTSSLCTQEMGGSDSKPNPPPEFERQYPHFKHFIQVGPGFWDYNTSFFKAKVVNIHTHMSIAQLGSGE